MKKFCKNHTFIFLLFVIAIAVLSNLVTGFLQNTFAPDLTSYYMIEAICKYIISTLPLILMIKWGYIKKSNWKQIVLGFGLGAIALLFCLPNLARFTLIDPAYYIIRWNEVVSIVIACFAIGLMEEAAIRGVIFPYLCEKWQEKPHSYLKAALASSLLFAVIHLNWSLRYIIVNGNLSFDFFLDNLYQVYYTFCFGMFAAGITLFSRSILPMVFWHGICDISAFIINGMITQSTMEYFSRKDLLTLQNVLDKFNIPLHERLVDGSIYLMLFLIGFYLVRKVGTNKKPYA